MVHYRWWEEEIRSFPCGGSKASLWVVRCYGEGPTASLRLVFSYAWDMAVGKHGNAECLSAPAVPLNRLLRVIQTGEAEEVRVNAQWCEKQGEAGEPVWMANRDPDPIEPTCRLWSEPLCSGSEVVGAFTLWYDARWPWGEAIKLWGSRFAARTGPVLDSLPVWIPATAALDGTHVDLDPQPTLFPLDSMSRDPKTIMRDCGATLGLPLPRPVFIPQVPGAVGVSRELRSCCAPIPKVATSGVNVLLCGESGTGKEIIARAIHLSSPRREGPLLGQNCAALPESLFESELFGHKSGAFTGAVGEKMGLLEAANGGTFFLDEIGDMPLALQIKLLRVMQERRVRRLGELKSRPVDIRFVAATHKDLDKEVELGRFRLDLYYRLKVVKLSVPPLRRRPEDVSHLLSYFLQRHGGRHSRRSITERALVALQVYRWPGNVRELENEVSRLLALYPEEPLIRLEHLSEEVRAATGFTVDPGDLATLRRLDEAGELLEQYLIRKAIAAAGGRKAAAARRLGLSRQGLYKKIQRYGMADLITGNQG